MELKVDQSHSEKTMGVGEGKGSGERKSGGGGAGIETHEQSPGDLTVESGLSHVSTGYH